MEVLKTDRAGEKVSARIKVAFYLENRILENRNLKDVKEGNPGIGGSEYIQLLTAYHLAKRFEDLEIIMYVTKEQELPEGIEVRLVENIEDALFHMKQRESDIFVLSNGYANVGEDVAILRLIEKYRVKTIVWAHIFMDYEQYKFISLSKYIRLFVCVGKQQLEMLRGLRLYKKATYINHMLPTVRTHRQLHDRKIVVYVGALYPYKGFDILARHWKYIKKNVPDAELWVIGSARLYGDDIAVGKYKIAEASYEEKFIPYLLNSNGEMDSSVKFWGTKGGREKEELVSWATVGIFNPCGLTETFGLTGVEFEAMGIPVVSIYKNSSLDIIKHEKTGLLYKKEEDFPEYIIKLLKNKEYNLKLGSQGRKFVVKEFNSVQILEEWYAAIVATANGETYRLKHDKKIMLDNQIWLHHINNFMKENIGEEKGAAWNFKITTGI